MKYHILFVLIVLFSCQTKGVDKEKIRQEIKKAEADFEMLCKERSIAYGFWFFADSNAVIKRGNDSLIAGKEAIRNYYDSDSIYLKAGVRWSPDFIDVAESGDLAYTYGKYVWTIPDTVNKKMAYRGVFHTVWKRQSTGEWKYVWD
jgi:ketosteroid isomerase-like protein